MLLIRARAERGGKTWNDNGVLIFHTKNGKVSEAWLPSWRPIRGRRVLLLATQAASDTEACKERQVVSIVCDPFRWTRTIQVLAGEGFPILEYPQTPGRLSPATSSFYEAAINGALSHDGSAELARHMSHAVIRTDARGTRITKDHKKSLRRIDLAVAAVMAYDRAGELASKTIMFW